MRDEVKFNPVVPIKTTLMRRIQKMKQKTVNEAGMFCRWKNRDYLRSTGRPKYAAGLYGMLLLHTCMRCGEMLALRWKDADMQGGFLTIEKAVL